MMQKSGILYTIQLLFLFFKIPMRPFTVKCIFCITPFWPSSCTTLHIAKLLSAAGPFKSHIEITMPTRMPLGARGWCRKGADTNLKNVSKCCIFCINLPMPRLPSEPPPILSP